MLTSAEEDPVPFRGSPVKEGETPEITVLVPLIDPDIKKPLTPLVPPLLTRVVANSVVERISVVDAGTFEDGVDALDEGRMAPDIRVDDAPPAPVFSILEWYAVEYCVEKIIVEDTSLLPFPDTPETMVVLETVVVLYSVMVTVVVVVLTGLPEPEPPAPPLLPPTLICLVSVVMTSSKVPLGYRVSVIIVSLMCSMP